MRAHGDVGREHVPQEQRSRVTTLVRRLDALGVQWCGLLRDSCVYEQRQLNHSNLRLDLNSGLGTTSERGALWGASTRWKRIM